MRLIVPFCLFAGETGARKIKKGTRWLIKQQRIEEKKLEQLVSINNERFGNTFFGDSLFDGDVEENISKRMLGVTTAGKEWLPCNDGVLTNDRKEGKQLTLYSNCMVDNGYSIAQVKCINWTKTGAKLRTGTKEGIECKSQCDEVLPDGSWENFCETTEVERGGKGKRKKKKGKKSTATPLTVSDVIETDGFLMFDDHFAESSNSDRDEVNRLDQFSNLIFGEAGKKTKTPANRGPGQMSAKGPKKSKKRKGRKGK